MSFLATALIKNLFRLSIVCSFLFAFQSGAFAVPDNVQDVFVRNTCLDCHSGATVSGSLSLDDATISEASLINIVSNCSNVGDILVYPGDINASVLHQKLTNVGIACGGVMPPSGNLISSADLAIIDNWIISIGSAQQFGLLTLQEASIDVNEDQTEIILTVNRELGNQGIVTVEFIASRIAGDSAENGTDFTETTGTLTFADGVTTQQITVPIIDDAVFEGTEVFTVQLTAGSETGGAVIGEPNLAKVNIRDNELDVNPGTFLFSSVSYSVDENVGTGTIEVTILRVFGATGEVSVTYSTSDSAAISGNDYQATTGILVFPEGDKNETFSITILEDAIEEESEFFNLTLSEPTGEAVLGSPNSVRITINDNDAAAAGGDNGGGDGDTGGTDNSGGVDIVATEDSEFESAGSLSDLLLFLIGLLLTIRYLKPDLNMSVGKK